MAKNGEVITYNKLVAALVVVILALAVVTILYIQAAGEVSELENGQGSILRAPTTSVSGEMN